MFSICQSVVVNSQYILRSLIFIQNERCIGVKTYLEELLEMFAVLYETRNSEHFFLSSFNVSGDGMTVISYIFIITLKGTEKKTLITYLALITINF